MNKLCVIALALIINLAALSAGCTNAPEPPGSEIPKLVIDFLGAKEGRNQTVLYVHGMDEVQYDNISIFLNDELVSSNERSFSMEYRTNLSSFKVAVNVRLEKSLYNYNASIRLVRGKEIVYRITHPDGDIKKVKWDNLPYVERLDVLEEGEQ